jgi:hypothetical protein
MRIFYGAVVISTQLRGANIAHAKTEVKKSPVPTFPCGKTNSPDDHIRIGDGAEISPKKRPQKASGMYPKHWDLNELEADARKWTGASKKSPMKVLAWYTEEDDRPVRNDNVFVWFKSDGKSPDRILTLYRHSWNKWWNSDCINRKELNKKPTNKEIEDYLNSVKWTWESNPELFKIIDGKIDQNSWELLTGQKAKKSFVFSK